MKTEYLKNSVILSICIMAPMNIACSNIANHQKAEKITRYVEKHGGTVNQISKSEIKEFNLPPEFEGAAGDIWLNYIDLSQINFKEIIPNKSLLSASFNGSNITDNQACTLQNCEQLRELYLDSTDITDEALICIAKIPSLNYLKLNRCDISNEGLKHLYQCKSLKELQIIDTHVTDDAVKNLKKHLPDLDVFWHTVRNQPTREALLNIERQGALILTSGGSVTLIL